MMVNGIEVIRDWRQALNLLENDPLIAVDLETGGLRPHMDKIAVVSMYGATTDALAILHVRGNVPPEVLDFLGRKDKEFIYHNGVGFDIPFLLAAGARADRPKIYDTMVGAGVVITTNRNGQRKSLQAEIDRRLGVYISKDSDHSRWMDAELSPKQISYCADDLLHLPPLRSEQIEKAKTQNQYSALMMEMELVPIVSLMTHNGLPISLSTLEDSQQTQKMFLDTVGKQFSDRFGNVNTNSPKQVQTLLESLGMIIPMVPNPKREIVKSTAAKVLEGLLVKVEDDNKQQIFDAAMSAIRLINKGYVANPENFPERIVNIRAKDIADTINNILRLREAHKRLDMYDQEWLDKFVHNGFIHSRFWQVGTDTGRFSSTEPNLQQWPRDFRGVIGNLEGHSIVSCDYSQLEVVVSAWISQDKALLQMIESGGDIHTLIASQIFGVPVSSIGKASKERQVAKACSFCLLFGGGAQTLMEYALNFGAVITLEEARDIVKRFFRQFRGAAADRQRAYDMAKQTKGVVELRLVNGLTRHLVGEKILPTTILNTRVQGNAAIGMKYALLEAKRKGLHKYLGATVHDELVACVPEEWAEEYGKELEKVMIKGMSNVVGCTVRAHSSIGRVWGK